MACTGVFVSIYQGLGMTPDSYLYLEGASHIAKNGLTGLLRHPAFQAKPPLYPFFLALLGNSFFLVKLSHVLFMIITLVVNFQLVDRALSESYWRQYCKVLIAIGTSLYLVHAFLWTEPMFIALLSCYFYGIWRYSEGREPKILLLLIMVAFLLVALRHVGIILTAAGSLYLLYTAGRTPGENKLTLVLHLLIPGIFFALWHLAVIWQTGSLDRVQHTQGLELWSNLQVFAHALKVWVVPDITNMQDDALSLLIPGGLAWLVVRIFQIPISREDHIVRFYIFCVAIYLGVMVLKGDLIASDVERYLSVIFIPLVTLMGFWFSFQSFPPRRERVVKVVSMVWLLYPLARTIKNLWFWGGW